VGVDRAVSVVALQGLLMTGVRDFGEHAGVRAQTHRLLATAASLDYVLMLATGSAGTRIAPADAQRAIRAGLARAVDDALLLLGALALVDDGQTRTFAREGMRTVRSTIASEELTEDDRTFALIALATDLCSQ
jgi:hypothetical protein